MNIASQRGIYLNTFEKEPYWFQPYLSVTRMCTIDKLIVGTFFPYDGTVCDGYYNKFCVRAFYSK